MDSLQNVYMAKKNEMETMMSKKVPDQVDFSLKDKDEPISNMDEMVKKYMRERDLDVPMVAAAAPQQQITTTMIQSEPTPSNQITPINIVQSEPQNISITIHDDDVPPPAPKRSVSFLDDTILQYMKSMQDEMKEMRKQIGHMQEMITTAFPGSVATAGSHIENITQDSDKEIAKDPIQESVPEPTEEPDQEIPKDPIQDSVPEPTEDPEASPPVATEEN